MFRQTGNESILEKAINATRDALHLTNDSCPDRIGWLSNLGNRLATQYEHNDDMQSLDEAIRITGEAARSIKSDHTDQALISRNLGHGLETRYQRTNDNFDWENARNAFQIAWDCTAGIPSRRVEVAARLMNIMGLQEEFDRAATLAVEGIDLLPTISNRSLQRSDQQYAVSHFSGLATSACSIYLRLGLPEKALEILERGRTVILNQLIGDRSDILSRFGVSPALLL
ncbi:hypothetical protein A1F94_006724 [Pyrenophora tritici-repentis]|uniref:Uncharacterized protein n=1 Tax=Pyrenophora tritici-repentis TaxID=45151 RepID=A0A2W1CQB4_9PLEO|nr:hypothetical protein PtrV1_13879 [Pyrenophora tritici-repentis]KAA8612337.1 hypothetical protein PtrV1_12906 [Pyrenophora tritici-repentis]KAF7447133.1 hypothetical protein A1F99_085800 [Pyrenophora tritici-repentis]KAF7569428.1 hypothetical protein PtrM4_118430 [Pyrenophora tritici-repentis]KAG9382803.1 hypothetical protein A1F94_006724 [Pyrenophora tritici-repentis]